MSARGPGVEGAPAVEPIEAGAAIVEVRHRPHAEEERRELLASLLADPPTIPSKHFYDERGLALFDAITELPEYYPTRTERQILERVAPEIAARTRATGLVEIGSGSAVKTRLLLDALRDVGTLRQYVPVDVNAAWLRRALLDWLYLATHGLDEIARLGIVPATARWSERRDVLVATARRLVGEAPAPDAQTR